MHHRSPTVAYSILRPHLHALLATAGSLHTANAIALAIGTLQLTLLLRMILTTAMWQFSFIRSLRANPLQLINRLPSTILLITLGVVCFSALFAFILWPVALTVTSLSLWRSWLRTGKWKHLPAYYHEISSMQLVAIKWILGVVHSAEVTEARRVLRRVGVGVGVGVGGHGNRRGCGKDVDTKGLPAEIIEMVIDEVRVSKQVERVKVLARSVLGPLTSIPAMDKSKAISKLSMHGEHWFERFQSDIVVFMIASSDALINNQHTEAGVGEAESDDELNAENATVKCGGFWIAVFCPDIWLLSLVVSAYSSVMCFAFMPSKCS